MTRTEEENPDAPPNEEEEEAPMEMKEFGWYTTSEPMFKIVDTRWGQFTILAGIIYLYHLCFTIAGVNMYADITRKNICGNVTGTGKIAEEDASAILDLAIAVGASLYLEPASWPMHLGFALCNVSSNKTSIKATALGLLIFAISVILTGHREQLRNIFNILTIKDH